MNIENRKNPAAASLSRFATFPADDVKLQPEISKGTIKTTKNTECSERTEMMSTTSKGVTVTYCVKQLILSITCFKRRKKYNICICTVSKWVHPTQQ